LCHNQKRKTMKHMESYRVWRCQGFFWNIGHRSQGRQRSAFQYAKIKNLAWSMGTWGQT
jgi:hypothetical protein